MDEDPKRKGMTDDLKLFRDEDLAVGARDAHLLSLSNVFLTDMGREFLDEYDLYGTKISLVISASTPCPMEDVESRQASTGPPQVAGRGLRKDPPHPPYATSPPLTLTFQPSLCSRWLQ